MSRVAGRVFCGQALRVFYLRGTKVFREVVWKEREPKGDSVGGPANQVEEDRPLVDRPLIFNKPHDNYIYIG